MNSIQPKDYVETVGKYLDELDSSFDKLSHKYEGKISGLPSYAFNKRHITILKFNNLDYFFIKVISDKSLDTDKAFTGLVSTNEELYKNSYPLEFDFDFDFKNPPKDYGINVVNVNVREVENINSLPVVDYCVLCVVSSDRFFDWFSLDKAKERALNEWNNEGSSFDKNYSFVNNLTKIFDKFELILNRDSFVERRLHRYINTHSLYFLPSFNKCFYEHELYLNGEKRVADFILERESGFPPLLIELESSFHKVFKKNEELTYHANHAGEQIKEWVKYIESNSDNCKSGMDFLTGPKDRLVVVGRGLECEEAMRDSKFGNNKVWTYDMLIQEAKKKWNKLIIDQCKIVGIKKPNLL
jgi:hypothetical protein